jgi:hypothetical protein
MRNNTPIAWSVSLLRQDTLRARVKLRQSPATMPAKYKNKR